MSDAGADPDLVCRDVMQRRRGSEAYRSALASAHAAARVREIAGALRARGERGDAERIKDLLEWRPAKPAQDFDAHDLDLMNAMADADRAAGVKVAPGLPVATPEPDDRAEWLQKRKRMLGASEVAAVLGLDPYRGPLAIYLSKVEHIEADSKPWMRFGTHVEAAIAIGYGELTGRLVTNLGANTYTMHPSIPWLGCTLDRVIEGSATHPPPQGCEGRGPLECKNVGQQHVEEWDGDRAPLHYQIQLQVQIACMGASWGSLAPLTWGNQIGVRDFRRDGDFLDAVYPALEAFWDRVQRRDPPPADALSGTGEMIRKAWPKSKGGTIALDGPTQDLADELDQLKAEVAEREGRIKLLDNQLRARMGDAGEGMFLDGSRITLTDVNVKAAMREAYSYRRMARKWPTK